jgi:hypothetical protein
MAGSSTNARRLSLPALYGFRAIAAKELATAVHFAATVLRGGRGILREHCESQLD